MKNYVKRRLIPYDLPNWVMYVDNCHFQQSWYVVIDDAGQFRQVKWDEPFPQSDSEWEDAAGYAIRKIKHLAPDLKIVLNECKFPIEDMSRYGELFEPVDGVNLEAFLMDAGDLIYGAWQISTNRNFFWDAIERTLSPYGPNANKIQLFPLPVFNEETLISSFLAYLVFSGPNAFSFAQGPGSIENPPALYAAIKNKLGSSIAPTEYTQQTWFKRGYRIWWRRCQGGIVYLNLSGLRREVDLPDDRAYFDSEGEQILNIFIDDFTASYVTTEPGDRIAKPRFIPRRPGLVTGPLTITMETEPFSSNTRIVYTLDGSEPDEGSIVYTGPFEIYESCVVKSRAFDAVNPFQRLPSFINFATYRLTEQEPTVEFHHVSDNGSEFLEHDYPVVSLSHVSAHPVTIRYYPLGGTAKRTQGPGITSIHGDYELNEGTLTIRPGEQHRYFYVHIVNDEEVESDETIMISISDPVNATLGENTIYTYTIEDNDHINIIEPNEARESNEEGFESGDFSAFDWWNNDYENWIVTSDEKNSGQYSAQAGSTEDDESSTLSIRLDCISGDISFYYKVSSERDCDLLEFYIDGLRQQKWSGEKDWAQVSFPVEEGTRTFEWIYSKDSSISRGSDTAWIDDIVFPIN